MKMRIKIRYLLAVAALAAAGGVFAQSSSKASLEQQKSRLQADINELNKAISVNAKNQKSRTVELQALRSKVRARQRLIDNINADIGRLDRQIDDKAEEVARLSRELDTLKASYARMCSNYYKNKSSGVRLMYILSSESFQQAYRRGKYIQEYVGAIRKRGQAVKAKNEQARAALAELKALKEKKTKLLAEQQTQVSRLKEDQGRIQQLLASLQKDKKRLEKELADKRQNAARIQKEISDLIAKELAAQRKKSGGKTSDGLAMTPEARQLSVDFAQNKGKLPWPVERGTIYMPFGTQTYPGLNVQIVNPGISISAPQGAVARAVFNGTVTRVQKQKNGLYNVFVNHGRYYTVYGDLERPSVTEGQKVSTKQAVGTVFTEKFEKKTILVFCLFDGTEKQDPESWLAQ